MNYFCPVCGSAAELDYKWSYICTYCDWEEDRDSSRFRAVSSGKER